MFIPFQSTKTMHAGLEHRNNCENYWWNNGAY